MQTNRISGWLIFGALALGACSAKTDDAAPEVPASGDYTASRDGRCLGEVEACEIYTKALDDQATALKCGPVTHLACPDFFRQSANFPAYDNGSIYDCKIFIQSFKACGDLEKRHCLVTGFPAPFVCASADGGTEAGAGDAADEVTSDATTGTDAPAETAVEAATGDAAAD